MDNKVNMDNKDNKDNMDNEDRYKQSPVNLPKLLKGQSCFFLLLTEVPEIFEDKYFIRSINLSKDESNNQVRYN
jgi:hypothetical protein